MRWPALPLSQWRATCDTLHLYTQIPGKIRLALAPEEPQWQHTALYVNSHGLTTGPMPLQASTLEMQFDFTAHELRVFTSEGGSKAIALVPRTVAAFFDEVQSALKGLGADISVDPVPQEVADRTPLSEDSAHHEYDRESIEAFWTILSNVDTVFRRYRAPFRGRHSRVQFFWGSFDLSYSRFSGRAAAPPPGANLLMRKGMDAQEVCAGFWFGDDRLAEPAFYCYAYPKPEGLEGRAVAPAAAFWSKDIGEFILRYDDVRAAPRPEELILEFLQATFAAGSSGW